MLNPSGPFALLNPFSKLCSGETQVLMLSFSPRESILVSASPQTLRARVLGSRCGLGSPPLQPWALGTADTTAPSGPD